MVEPASARGELELSPCRPQGGVRAGRGPLLQELLGADVIEEQGALARAHGDDILIEAQRAHAYTTLSGAKGSNIMLALARIQEGDVGLGAHREQRQLVAVGQAHVFSAVGQPDGQQLGQGSPDFPQVEVPIQGHRSQLLILATEDQGS